MNNISFLCSPISTTILLMQTSVDIHPNIDGVASTHIMMQKILCPTHLLHAMLLVQRILYTNFLLIDEKKKNFVSDKKAIEIFKEVTNLSSTSDVNKLNKLERNVYIRLLRDKGLTVKQVSRIMDISQATVKRITSWNSKK